MCIGVPGQIVSISEAHAIVDFNGTSRNVSLLTLPEALAGDWIIAHSGFAVKRISPEEATESIKYLVDALDGPDVGSNTEGSIV
ncbi:MAG: HypC/HybG/HupF family hydrogenase formation chaperone [Acidimicrobiia bacterium]|nr:HypC/HybG/HupF family hydrogenase formation chaperone [Acidimicrobiia bacterium]NNL28697.1 HypC/HybG/HupF family hydrogenase formation chaperone [Acidimicrobiia bacterium]